MKKLLFSSILTIFAFSFFSCDKLSDSEKKSLVPIEIWYSPYSSADAPLPSDWFGFKKIENDLGIKLKAVPLPSKREEQAEVLLKAARSNSLPDFFMVNRELLVQLVKENKVARLDSIFQLMPTRTRLMYTGEARKNGMFDGLTYGLSQVGSIDKNEGVLIRKDWLDKLGLGIPVTTEDFFNVMNAFTFNDPDGNGKDDTFGWGAFIEINNHEEGLGRRFSPFFGAFGVAGTFNATREKTGLNIKKPEFYDALDFVRKMVSAKVIDPNWTAYKKDDFREAWKNGRFGMMREQNAAFALETNYRPFDEKFPDGEWILIDPPTGPKGKKSVGCYTQAYRTFAVSRRTAELGKLPVLANLLEWMMTDGYNIICYGEENVNFREDNGEITTEGLFDPALAYTQKAAAPLLQLRNLVFYGSDEELKSRYPTWKSQNGKEMSALKILREMQKCEWTPSVGVPSPSQEVKMLYEQGVLDFVTGKRNLTRTNWTDWLSEFNRRGGEEWNKQCLDYVEANNSYID